MPQFYLDSSNFATATAVYVDAGLTVLAPDGYYSSHGIVRSQVNGQLSAYAECESCKGYQKPVEGELLLDLYPGAVAAFSLNQLSTPYTGAAVRVRRASDSVEQDIGFTSEFVLDVAALDSFCSGTDGFVVTWYNQDGSGNDAVQATTSAQPQIVASGAVSLDPNTGLPAIKFNGSNTSLQNSAFGSLVVAPNFAFGVVNFQSTANQYYTDSIATGRSATGIVSGNYSIRGLNGGSASTGVVLMTSQQLATGAKLYVNGTQALTNPGSTLVTWSNVILGTGQTGLYLNGYLSGFILYNSDQSADRAGIENALNQQYNIYWDGTVTALLDDYPGAVGAFSVRALNSFYTGPIMRVRRSSDSAEQDIKALYSGDLDTSALATFCAGTDGFVVTWYDQSGNGNDATQTTAANQPKIYDSVTGVVTDNGKPAVDFDGVDDALNSSSSVSLPLNNAFALVAKGISTAVDEVLNINNTSGLNVRIQSNNVRVLCTDADQNNVASASNNQFLLYAGRQSSTNTVHGSLNGGAQFADTSLDSGSWNTATGTLHVGARGGTSLQWDGQIQEVIYYDSDKLSDRTGIETNINDYFNIY